jgi:hypothetical protein
MVCLFNTFSPVAFFLCHSEVLVVVQHFSIMLTVMMEFVFLIESGEHFVFLLDFFEDWWAATVPLFDWKYSVRTSYSLSK